MSTVATQIRIDAEVKKEATELFSNLGLDMSGAVNLFLHQCILRGGLPFSVEMPNYRKETLEAMEEAERLAHDPDAVRYKDMESLKAALYD